MAVIKGRRAVLDRVKEVLAPLLAASTIDHDTFKAVVKDAPGRCGTGDVSDSLVDAVALELVLERAELPAEVAEKLRSKAAGLRSAASSDALAGGDDGEDSPKDASNPAAADHGAASKGLSIGGLLAFVTADRERRKVAAAAAAAGMTAAANASAAAAAVASSNNTTNNTGPQAAASSAEAKVTTLVITGCGRAFGAATSRVVADTHSRLSGLFAGAATNVVVPHFPGGGDLPSATVGTAVAVFPSADAARKAVGQVEAADDLLDVRAIVVGGTADQVVKLHVEDCAAAAKAHEAERTKPLLPEPAPAKSRLQDAPSFGGILETPEDELYADLTGGAAAALTIPRGGRAGLANPSGPKRHRADGL